MSDASVKEATGCNWERWVRTLDRAGRVTLARQDRSFQEKRPGITGLLGEDLVRYLFRLLDCPGKDVQPPQLNFRFDLIRIQPEPLP